MSCPQRRICIRKVFCLMSLAPFAILPLNLPIIILGLCFARQALFSSVINYRTPSSMELGEWIMSLLDCKDLLCSQLLCVIVQKVWHAGNLMIYQRKVIFLQRVAANALFAVEEYNLRNLEVLAKKGSPITLALESVPSKISIFQVDAGVFPYGSVVFGCVFKKIMLLAFLLWLARRSSSWSLQFWLRFWQLNGVSMWQ
ncbi:unnamed protein product [Vicia faba]|uniref:Uncharacterized protein n=1 Tax=Vicia faba TaxID=3906 RepID=A0AAV1A4V1_VICFA|nr:unnamed protein product [Vicia faba]